MNLNRQSAGVNDQIQKDAIKFYEALAKRINVPLFYLFTPFYDFYNIHVMDISETLQDVYGKELKIDFDQHDLKIKAISGKYVNGFESVLIAPIMLQKGFFYIPQNIIKNSSNRDYIKNALPPFFFKDITLYNLILLNKKTYKSIYELYENGSLIELQKFAQHYDNLTSILNIQSIAPEYVINYLTEYINSIKEKNIRNALLQIIDVKEKLYSVLNSILEKLDFLFNNVADNNYNRIKNSYYATAVRYTYLILNYQTLRDSLMKKENPLKRVFRKYTKIFSGKRNGLR